VSAPVVTVILPVKNGARYLAEAIDSVMGQHYQPVELIVVVGPSVDETETIARSYAQVRTIDEPPGLGIAGARNAGINAAAGEFVGFLSHDDTWDPIKLSRQIDYFNMHPDAECVVTRIRYRYDGVTPLPAAFRAGLLHSEPVGAMPETLLARRSVFDRVGQFAPEYKLGEDIDWFIRAADYGVSTGIIPMPLVIKRVHEGNLSCQPGSGPVFQRDLLAIARQSILRKRRSGQGAPL
jgi:glycosyltransferase involved in cell wall biosynthesis